MYAAAIAAGVTATFGAPIGGVLYSIEVSATYYMVSNLWKAFFCTTCGILLFRFLAVFEAIELFDMTKFDSVPVDYEIFFFALLGLICGLVGALFIHVLTKIIFLKVRLKLPFISDRWKWSLSVALIVGLISFPVQFMQLPDKKVINAMFNNNDLGDQRSKPVF